MKMKELQQAGIPKLFLQAAHRALVEAARDGMSKPAMKRVVRQLAEHPEALVSDLIFGEVAKAIAEYTPEVHDFVPRTEAAPYQQWGADLDEKSIDQMRWACALPVSVRGALMPDAHVGYGLPIGGVLATKDSVIPYAVGVDIACRVKMTVLDWPVDSLWKREDSLKDALIRETQFGVGASFKKRREHQVMDEDWSVSPVTRQFKDKAWAQLGTSGSGNHFVEFGGLEITRDDLGLKPGVYLALLSHSGSRGTGAAVCQEYSKRAMAAHPELPKELKHLSWLDLASDDGAEYWAAMNLMGEYASANHACIHREIAKKLSAEVMLDVENHHNFAWKEMHGGEELIVHRKGATPAGAGVLGIIPGSMASSCFVVRGLGQPESLNSAAHGAGRVMSRTQARKTLHWNDAKRMLDERGVKLLSAGLDEAPAVYKDIHEVMSMQADLVEPLSEFMPRLVKRDPAGERPAY